MLKVYHNRNFLDRAMDTSDISGDECVLAAEVDTDDLQEGFIQTNTFMHPWTENRNVRPTGQSRRSTSVGDVLVQGSKMFVVESCGFRETAAEEAAALILIQGA